MDQIGTRVVYLGGVKVGFENFRIICVPWNECENLNELYMKSCVKISSIFKKTPECIRYLKKDVIVVTSQNIDRATTE